MHQLADAAPAAQFTSDWWTRKIPDWTRFIRPLFRGVPTRALEVGSYEGRSASWILKQLLNHPESSLICVDRWTDDAIEDRFDRNIRLSGLGARVHKGKGDAFDVLRRLESTLDLVYLDADHRSSATLALTVLVWPRLRRGGVLVWDDYGWHRERVDHPDRTPARGIDAFLSLWEGQYELLWKNYQVAVRKL